MTSIKSKSILAVFALWLFLSCAQTAHFYYYYDQSFSDSVRWSFRDWSVWFLLFALIYKLLSNQSSLTKLTVRSVLIISLVAIASGALQVLIIVSLDFIAGHTAQPFLEDFHRLYNKRWFDYLFTFAVFWSILMTKKTMHAKRGLTTASDPETKIRLNDGKQVHWFYPHDIIHFEAAGNYVSVHTRNDETVVRDTLKNIESQLDPNEFIRISRSSLINKRFINACQKHKGKWQLSLCNSTQLNVGPTYLNNIKQHLELS